MNRVLILLLCLGLYGCATTYGPAGLLRGGYSSFKLQDDIYRVSFRGNGLTTVSRAEDFALLRCAELTLNNKYKYFLILDKQNQIITSMYTSPVTSTTTGNINMYSAGDFTNGTYSGNTTYSGGDTTVINKPLVTTTIQCFKEKPNTNGIVYDAEQVSRNLKGSYGIGGVSSMHIKTGNIYIHDKKYGEIPKGRYFYLSNHIEFNKSAKAIRIKIFENYFKTKKYYELIKEGRSKESNQIRNEIILDINKAVANYAEENQIRAIYDSMEGEEDYKNEEDISEKIILLLNRSGK